MLSKIAAFRKSLTLRKNNLDFIVMLTPEQDAEIWTCTYFKVLLVKLTCSAQKSSKASSSHL